MMGFPASAGFGPSTLLTLCPLWSDQSQMGPMLTRRRDQRRPDPGQSRRRAARDEAETPAWDRAARRPCAAGLVVRPVCGLETFSEETSRPRLRARLPATTRSCSASPTPPIRCCALVRRLIAAIRGCRRGILVGDERISDNPKLNNCVGLGGGAARLDRHRRFERADAAGLPAAPAGGVARRHRPRLLDAGRRPPGRLLGRGRMRLPQHLQARWQYAGEAVGLGFAQGKSMLWQRAVPRGAGRHPRARRRDRRGRGRDEAGAGAGRRVHLVAAPFEQPLGRRTASEVWSRQIRWARLRRVTFPLFFAPEILSARRHL